MRALMSMDALTHLDNSTNLPKLVDKLPGYLQSRWRGLALKLWKESPPRRPALVDLVEFVEDAALEANDPLFGVKQRKPQPTKGTSLVIAAVPTAHSAIANPGTRKKAPECAVCK